MTLLKLIVPARNFVTSAIRSGTTPGVGGTNLPFDISRKYKLTASFMVFMATGFGLPFLLVRHQLLKK